ncbi:MAG: DUF192 domain-containing protein [Pirellulaceae bacterium]
MVDSWQLVQSSSGQVVVPRLALAVTFWQRLRGLQFRRRLSSGSGLLLAPCRSIHTHWMFFAIDVAMLDSNGQVLALHRAVSPWSILYGPAGTHIVVEALAGGLAGCLAVGDGVCLQRTPTGDRRPGAKLSLPPREPRPLPLPVRSG